MSMRPAFFQLQAGLPHVSRMVSLFVFTSYKPFVCSACPVQLGSNTLGRVIDEDAEKGLVYWDVFKSARLDSLKERKLLEGKHMGCHYNCLGGRSLLNPRLPPTMSCMPRAHHFNFTSCLSSLYRQHTQTHKRTLTRSLK